MKFVFRLLLLSVVVYSCKKEDFGSPGISNATLSISAPTEFSLNGVTLFCSSVTSLDDSRYTYGFCYSATNRKPTIPGLATGSNNFTAGSFSAQISNVEYGKLYYVRAFVTNGIVTTYSNADSFLMPAFIGVSEVRNISSRSFSVDITRLASIPGTISEWGICYGTGSNPDTSKLLKPASTNIPGTVSMDVADTLKAGTTYYLRNYVIADGRIYYSRQVSFKTAGYKGAAGGYVFFDKGDTTGGWRYLEAAPDTVLITNAAWGCSGTHVPGTLQTWGSGLANTAAIMGACTLSDIAAVWCDSLLFKGRSDWYLPATDELKMLYQLKLSQLTATSGFLLSSTQADARNCYYIDMATGSIATIGKDETAALTWPVRRFL